VAGLTGRADLLPMMATRGTAAARCAPETAALQLNISWWELFGLGLAGQLASAAATLERMVSTLRGHFFTHFQPVFEGWLALLAGRVTTAATLLRGIRPR